MHVELRQVTADDAEVLLKLYRTNRTFLAPWEPKRDDSFFTEHHQRRQLAQAGVDRRSGRALPCVILADDRVVGRININDIVRGAFDSAHLGYWVAEEMNGRGVATAAVAAAARLCFEDLGLRRVTANCFADNTAPWRLIERVGMRRETYAVTESLHRSGEWLDTMGYGLLAEERISAAASRS